MKKIITLLAAVALSISFLSAQNARRAVGDKSFDLGIGINLTNGYSIMFPPIDASFEYTVLDFGTAGTLSAAGVASFGMDKYKSVNVSSFFVGPQAVYRFPIMDNLDLFGKVAIGYCSITAGNDIYKSLIDHKGFAWCAYAGATYYFSEKMGVGLQFGNGLSTAELHLTIRL